MSDNSHGIRVIITGGTFDKKYNEINGELFFQESHVVDMLKMGRVRLKINLQTLMMIDSLEMTAEQREIIADYCSTAPEDRIVITHGTDTMVDTARVIAGYKLEKTIVLTGAMVPYTFSGSDGLFNLGTAIAFTQSLPAGVYIAMNGRYFDWNNVRKNKERGEFEELT